MAAAEVGIKFAAEFAEFKRELQSMPGLTDKEAQKMARAFVRRQNEMTRQMSKAAKEAEKAAMSAADKQRAALEGAKQAAEGLGGAIGGTAGQVEKMIQSSLNLGAALGPTGAVIGAAVVGLGLVSAAAAAAGYAIYSIVDGADEALDRLRELEGTEPISQAALTAIDDYGRATLGLEAATLQLRVALAEDLAPALTTTVDLLALAVEGGTELYETLQLVSESATGAGLATNSFEGAVAAMLGPVAGTAVEMANWSGATDAVREALAVARGEIVDTTEETHALQGAASGVAAQWDAMVDAMGRDAGLVDLERRTQELEHQLELTTQLRLATGEWSELDAAQARQQLGLRVAAMRQQREAAEAEKAAREAEREQRERQREQDQLRAEALRREASEVAAVAAAEAMLYDLRADGLTAEQRAIDAAEQRAQRIAELAAAGIDAETRQQLELANTRQLTEDLAAIEQQRADEQARLDAERMARIEAMHAQQRQLAQETAAAELAAQREIEDATAAMYGGLSQLAGTYADVFAGSREDMTEAEKQAALTAFEISRATALAQVAVQGAVAIARTLAELGPIAGPIAAVGVGATVVAQGVAIASQPPPEFPGGGLIHGSMFRGPSRTADHGLVGAQAGEGIVSRRGMAALGEQGLDSLNRGEAPAQRMEVVMQYRHRIFDRFIRDNLQRPGPLSTAIGGGRRVGHHGR